MALVLLASLTIAKKSFAKYVMQDTLAIGIYLDKTPPIISVASDGRTESFQELSDDTIKKKADVTIHTSDNVQIKQNLYQYHLSDPNFAEAETQEFENGKVFSEEGFYKIITVDTSGNQTEIIILLDKSVPDVCVEYFKRGEASLLKQTVATTKSFTMQNVQNGIEENIAENEKNSNEIVNEIIQETEETLEDIEEVIQVPIQNEEVIETVEFAEMQEAEETQEIKKTEIIEDEIMLMSVEDMYVGNETEFRNALAMQTSVIHIRQSIDFSAPIYINYAVTIVNEGLTNSLRYANNGSFIIVQNGGSLTINGMIVDTNSFGRDGIIAIDIQSGGYVTFVNSSIVDAGLRNTGILVNQNASLLLWSCEILRCGYGINLQMNGNLYFATQEGRSNNFYANATAIFVDNFYGTCNFNQNISMHDNTDYGIHIAGSIGNINISAGNYYQNTYCIRASDIKNSTVTISGGSYYSNGWAIWVGGNVNLTGGLIYNNYYGVFLHEIYNGCFRMTGGNIYSNTSSAIYHKKTNDGGCTITGGSISGEIYLQANNNYVNTNSSYPTLTITPSSYYFKRKLVRTTNNSTANSEISKVTVTPKDSWYKYADNEYIVLWNGGNVIVRYKDYSGNILKQETLNGTIGNKYSITPPDILGYDVISIPANATGFYTKQDIFVDFKYDLVNVAKVTFEDLLSGVTSAKYWYHANAEEFTGEGIDFVNGSVFENYGYYKVVVRNGVGLEKEVKFVLNKNSLIR